MKSYLIIVSVMYIILLTGCSTRMQHNYTPKIVSLNKPEINQVITAYIGDVLLLQGSSKEVDIIFLKKNMVFGLFNTHTAIHGSFTKVGENNNKEFYLPTNNTNSGRLLSSGNAFNGLMAVKGTHTLCALTGDVEFCTENAPFERQKVTISSPNSFQETLIYSGKIGNKIHIGYREFSGNTARPAFSNEVEYDISTSRTIGYKSARLKIIKANNEYIKYKVLKNFK